MTPVAAPTPVRVMRRVGAVRRTTRGAVSPAGRRCPAAEPDAMTPRTRPPFDAAGCTSPRRTVADSDVAPAATRPVRTAQDGRRCGSTAAGWTPSGRHVDTDGMGDRRRRSRRTKKVIDVVRGQSTGPPVRRHWSERGQDRGRRRRARNRSASEVMPYGQWSRWEQHGAGDEPRRSSVTCHAEERRPPGDRARARPSSGPVAMPSPSAASNRMIAWAVEPRADITIVDRAVAMNSALPSPHPARNPTIWPIVSENPASALNTMISTRPSISVCLAPILVDTTPRDQHRDARHRHVAGEEQRHLARAGVQSGRRSASGSGRPGRCP